MICETWADIKGNAQPRSIAFSGESLLDFYSVGLSETIVIDKPFVFGFQMRFPCLTSMQLFLLILLIMCKAFTTGLFLSYNYYKPKQKRIYQKHVTRW